MKNALYLLSLLIISASGMAQDSASQLHRGSLLVKWTPLSLLDLEKTIQCSGEYFIEDRSSVQVELGYGPPFLSYGRSSLDNRQAWRLRTEFRLYRQREPEKGRYWAVEGFAMTVNGFNSLYADSFSGSTAAVVSFPIHKRVAGGHVKAGIQRAFGRSKHVYYDFYAGLGIRHVHVYADSIGMLPYIHPVGGQFFDPYRPRGRQLLPGAVLGIKLAYRLR